MNRTEPYRTLLNCLPQPACLLENGKLLFANEAAGDAFAALLEQPLPELPAVLAAGGWTYTLRPLDGLCLALAERVAHAGEDVSFLRLPLGELFGSVSSLMPAVEDLEDPAIHRKAANVNRSLYRLYRAVSNLDFAAADLTPHLRPVNLTVLLEELRERLPATYKNDVKVAMELPAASVPVFADAELLERAVLNLLSNAIRHAAGGSTVQLTLKKQNDRAMISVRNEGTPADPDQIFGGAEQAHMHGTAGLGLELVRKIMQLLGGTLLFRMPEDGTVATMALPLRSGGMVLENHRPKFDLSGGFNTVLLELSDVLPVETFLPEAID